MQTRKLQSRILFDLRLYHSWGRSLPNLVQLWLPNTARTSNMLQVPTQLAEHQLPNCTFRQVPPLSHRLLRNPRSRLQSTPLLSPIPKNFGHQRQSFTRPSPIHRGLQPSLVPRQSYLRVPRRVESMSCLVETSRANILSWTNPHKSSKVGD